MVMEVGSKHADEKKVNINTENPNLKRPNLTRVLALRVKHVSSNACPLPGSLHHDHNFSSIVRRQALHSSQDRSQFQAQADCSLYQDLHSSRCGGALGISGVQVGVRCGTVGT
jgi:hypothetical protein